MNCEATNDEDEAVEKKRTLLIPKLGFLQVEKWREIERKFMGIDVNQAPVAADGEEEAAMSSSNGSASSGSKRSEIKDE
nr:hypothetical protein Iba_chr07bCG2280 [Ipomoea batatas]GMD71806.1 hypothetical protein Iba_chr12fCG2420 [Ipomoea batatas]GME05772.1 hypothetical protein Iba_scaffold3316CG0190 [Ipomoea batatas]GME09986.1 hypothetical protein Iba_scaffold9307CG0010 [Ipomoea batatas]GME15863.1 hypothetical protein Iba_scaffold16833CG0060 [Ipomoea batatas]